MFYELLGRLYCVALRQVPIVQCSNYGKGLASKMPPPPIRWKMSEMESRDGGREADHGPKNPCAPTGRGASACLRVDPAKLRSATSNT